MPAWRIDQQDVQVCHFDVGGVDGPVSTSLMHVALCVAEQPIVVNSASRMVPVIHMGPPLEHGANHIDVLGTAMLDPDTLQPSERRKIKAFVDDRLRERKAQEERLKKLKRRDRYCVEYVIHPPYLEPDEEVSLWRFNCAGFVLRAYQEADIDLVDRSSLADVSLAELKASYPHMAAWLAEDSIRLQLGIGQGTAWPVVLPGHVINSLARQPDAIRAQPYAPVAGDEFFPPRPPQTLPT